MNPQIPTIDSSAMRSFDGFLAFLRESNNEHSIAILSPARFSAILNIDTQTLAQQAHVHRNTITRTPGSESVQRFLREALRVIHAAVDISGDMGNAIFWYRNHPLAAFGYKTAEKLVEEGRTEDLLPYLASLDAGVAG